MKEYKKSLIIIFIIFSLIVQVYQVQANVTESSLIIWEKTFGDELDEKGISAIQLKDGFLIYGTKSYDNENSDILIMKIDEDGTEVWNKKYGGENDDVILNVQKTHDDNFICIGYTNSFGAGLNDIFVIEIDENGNEIWQNTYGTEKSDKGYYIFESQENLFSIIGSVDDKYLYFAKINHQGEPVTVADSIELPGEIRKIINSNDNCYYIIGFTTSEGPYSKIVDYDGDVINTDDKYNSWIMKIDNNGSKVWENICGNINIDSLSDICLNDEGRIGLIGSSVEFYGSDNFWFFNFHPDGSHKIERVLKKGSASHIISLENKGFIIFGVDEIVLADTIGNILWETDLNKDFNLQSIVKIDNDEMLLVGSLKNSENSDYDIYVIKETYNPFKKFFEENEEKISENIGFIFDLNKYNIPISGDFQFPIRITSQRRIPFEKPCPFIIEYDNDPFTITGEIPSCVTKYIDLLDLSKYSLDNSEQQYILDTISEFIPEVPGKKITCTIGYPIGMETYTLYKYSPTPITHFYLFLTINGDVISDLIINGPCSVDKTQVSFQLDDNITVKTLPDSNPGDHLEIILNPVYELSLALSVKIDIGISEQNILPSAFSETIKVFPTDDDMFSINFPTNSRLVINSSINKQPRADFDFTCVPTDDFYYKTTFQDKSIDEDGLIVKWYWEVDEGKDNILIDQIDEFKNPSHLFPETGDHTVMLNITDDAGDTSTIKKTITIEPGQLEILNPFFKKEDRFEDPVKGTVVLKGKANAINNNDKIEKVEISIESYNGPWSAATGTQFWSYELDTTKISNGYRSIFFRSTDGTNFSDIYELRFLVQNSDSVPGFESVICSIAIGLYIIYHRKNKKN